MARNNSRKSAANKRQGQSRGSQSAQSYKQRTQNRASNSSSRNRANE